MSVDDVVGRGRAATAATLVEITGGEPLLQEDVYPLMERLLDARAHRAARNRRPPQHRPRAGRRGRAIVDVKCPGQRRGGQERLGQPRRLRAARRSEVRRSRIAPTTSSRATSSRVTT